MMGDVIYGKSGQVFNVWTVWPLVCGSGCVVIHAVGLLCAEWLR